MVHPKTKNVSFTHSQVVPNPYEFLLLSTQEDILKNMGKKNS